MDNREQHDDRLANENLDALKHSITGSPKYRLPNSTNVFVSPGGYHFIDHLDPVEEISPEIDETKLTDEEIAYIERSLQSNAERFENQIATVKSQLDVQSKKALDIGCGGGLFLSKLKEEGATVMGIELSDTRAHYAKTTHQLDIIKRPIEAEFWKEHYENAFDIVTLWDVIEHVNYPLSTLRSASLVLKDGGYVFIDTPCRDSFYHRFGDFTYRLSKGRFPTTLVSLYSAGRFGHKQILSTREIRTLFEQANFEVVELKKFHELSFPYSFYLKKIFKSDLLVKLLLPFVHVLVFIFPVKNKMLVIGRKKDVADDSRS